MSPPVPTRGRLTPSVTKAQGATAGLRILSTTDIHMQLTGFDYVTDTPSPHSGLAGIGTLITQARAEAAAKGHACLLLDNGDMLQGTPLGDHLARQPLGPTHAAIASLNALKYDALGVGNHDLDFGLPYLQGVAAHLDSPMVASNLHGDALAPLHKSHLLECALPAADAGGHHLLKIGILSVLPKQTEVWNQHWLQGHATIQPAMEGLQELVDALRDRGADVVILLAHMGITPDTEADLETALELAQTSGVNAIIAGHTHRRFPGRDHEHSVQVDTASGRLCGVPAIMTGHSGSDLGVLDLTLTHNSAQNGWNVTGHVSTLIPNTADTQPLPAIISAVQPAHDALRAELRMPLGSTDQPLHSYFSIAAPTPSAAFMARAKMRAIAECAHGTADAALPLLASVAAHTAGGRDGPDHYLSIQQGSVLRRHLAGLNPHNDKLLALRITGADLRRWLEHAACVFSDLSEDRPGTLLKRSNMPAFMFETVFGVTYCIDPTQPLGARIGNLCWNGVAVRDDQMFLMATTQFRAAGGGGYTPCAPSDIALRMTNNAEDMLHAALSDPVPSAHFDHRPWHFNTPTPIETELRTSPAAQAYFDDIADLQPRPMGLTDAGFLRVMLTL